MPINYPSFPQHLTRDEMGVPDLGAAIQQGFKTAGMGMETAYKPKTLQEALLHSQLQNKMLQQDLPYRSRLHESALRAAQDAHQKALMETDPNAKLDYYRKLKQGMLSGGFGGGMQQPSEMPQPIEPMTGRGAVLPVEEQQRMFQQEQEQRRPSGGDFMGGQSPLEQAIYRGMIKDMTGIDPYQQSPETPQQKMQRQIETARQKEMLKQQMANGTALTPTSITKHQDVVSGVDSALPILDELIKDKTVIPTGFEWAHPSEYASYHGQVNSIIEPLIGAMGLNVTDSTKSMMQQQVLRRANESIKAYKKRLGEFRNDLLRRKKYSYGLLNSGRVNKGGIESMSDEELQRIADGGQ